MCVCGCVNAGVQVCGCMDVCVCVCGCVNAGVQVCGCMDVCVGVCGCVNAGVQVCGCLWCSSTVCTGQSLPFLSLATLLQSAPESLEQPPHGNCFDYNNTRHGQRKDWSKVVLSNITATLRMCVHKYVCTHHSSHCLRWWKVPVASVKHLNNL